MNIKPPPPDPELERQKAAARADKISSIQDQVGALTDQLIRSFGSRSALMGSSVAKPPILGF